MPLAIGAFYVYTINMAADGNSVNIENLSELRDSYHHGDLRGALIRAGIAALDSGEAFDDLSLRRLARTVGVSATAVYRHFPDKAALLNALADAGLDRMHDMQHEAARAAAPGGQGAAFCASGAAYVRFALTHPELFRLIWRKAPSADLLDPSQGSRHPAMIALRNGIDAVLPDAATAEERRVVALKSWGLVHGLATLALDRQVVLNDAIIDRVISSAILSKS